MRRALFVLLSACSLALSSCIPAPVEFYAPQAAIGKLSDYSENHCYSLPEVWRIDVPQLGETYVEIHARLHREIPASSDTTAESIPAIVSADIKTSSRSPVWAKWTEASAEISWDGHQAQLPISNIDQTLPTAEIQLDQRNLYRVSVFLPEQNLITFRLQLPPLQLRAIDGRSAIVNLPSITFTRTSKTILQTYCM